jgi:hypothetical protein
MNVSRMSGDGTVDIPSRTKLMVFERSPQGAKTGSAQHVHSN